MPSLENKRFDPSSLRHLPWSSYAIRWINVSTTFVRTQSCSSNSLSIFILVREKLGFILVLLGIFTEYIIHFFCIFFLFFFLEKGWTCSAMMFCWLLWNLNNQIDNKVGERDNLHQIPNSLFCGLWEKALAKVENKKVQLKYLELLVSNGWSTKGIFRLLVNLKRVEKCSRKGSKCSVGFQSILPLE